MIEINEALSLINGQAWAHRSVRVKTVQSVGHVIFEPIYAQLDLPSFDNSAMDGYAVFGDGTKFKLVGEIAAGQIIYDRLKAGEAMRIFTGARVPEGTSAVVKQELAILNGDQLTVSSVSKGDHIRRQAEEVRQGQLLLEAGHCISPASVGLLLSQGIVSVNVHASPKVSVLVTGDELVDPENALVKGQIFESNGGMLVAALMEQNVTEVSLLRVKDDLDQIKNQIDILLGESDILLISGGVSVGAYDYVKEGLEANGVNEIFYRVLQKPGKPLYFGRKENAFVFGLPGNPCAALTCFNIYVKALLAKLQGKSMLCAEIPLAEAHTAKGTKPVLLRAKITDGKATVLKNQSSSMLTTYVGGNGLILLQPGEYQAGTQVTVWYS
ncbi:MAG: molybdopterin molybdotransferase MoeA [Marinoscillum sp.]